ncbi:hypothetical protein GBF38_019777 [Nibea albiflora]|uniref:Uncharacterized protein n=1 Tax=Nibea albiflora TaxID=240163 RepID=A0ACB7F2L2_NIBAL|nr:hypothetical protein GBF38_019777 [Nibea albiflora]
MSQERGQKKYKAFQLSISITEPEPSVQEVLKPLRLEVDRLQACAMTVRIFLLVSAVAQLASPALLPHTQQPEKRNVTDFKNIHDVVEKCISSPSKDFFVDDITHLTEGENACGVESPRHADVFSPAVMNMRDIFGPKGQGSSPCGNKQLPY